MLSVQQIWQSALNSFQKGLYQQAIANALQIPAYEKQPQILVLLAKSQRQLGNISSALNYIDGALSIQVGHPELRTIKGNILKEAGQFSAASDIFGAIITDYPNEFSPVYNLALVYKASQQFELAISCLQKALSLKSEDINANVLLAQMLAKTDQISNAKALYEKLFETASSNLLVLNNYLSFLLSIGQFAKAIDIATPLLESSTNLSPAIVLLLARANVQAGNHEQADILYKRYLQSNPNDISVIDEFAKFAWARGDEHWQNTYTDAATNVSDSLQVELSCKHVLSLIKMGRLDAALTWVEKYLNHAESPSLLTLHGYLLREVVNIDAGITVLQQAYAQQPKDIELRKELGVGWLIKGDSSTALQLFSQLIAEYPNDRGLFAHWCTANSLSANSSMVLDKYLNYREFVAAKQLKFPPQYASVNHFNEDLKRYLLALHREQNYRPVEQSLRGGTQTFGQLFNRDDNIIKMLKLALRETISEYLDGLRVFREQQISNSEQVQHPLLAPLDNDFRFSDSWSILLHSDGFHKNHFHHRGWVSAVYYVDVPDAVQHQGQGWLKFGQPDMSKHLSLEPDYCIKPEVGTLVLFPSYLWHGTNGFSESAKRLTVAFDIVPKAKL